MTHILNRETMRVVVRDDNNGRVKKRTTYKRGDEVDTSEMVESHVDNLVASGALVESEDDLSDPEDPMGISPTGGPFGASTDGRGDPTVPEDEQVVAEGTDQPEDFDDDDDDGGGSPFDPAEAQRQEQEAEVNRQQQGGSSDEEEHLVDKYDEMDHAELQKDAKSKGLSAGGSTSDLRGRLRHHDAS